MQIYTSYFYKVRFFKPNMIPISTAKYDPKWYFNFQKQGTVWQDKNGVVNGLRAPVFAPLVAEGCGPQCNNDPINCSFMSAYRNQLNQLDFDDIMTRTKTLCQKVLNYYNIEGEPIAVFLVHEAPNNPCSERKVIQEWFKSNGIEVGELE